MMRLRTCAWPWLVALLGSAAWGAPDDAGGGGGLVVVLENGRDAEGRPHGCYFEASGKTPPLMDGTRLDVTLQARGRSRDFPVKILRAVVQDNTYKVSYPWQDRVFAPLAYEVKVELAVGKQAKRVQQWLMTEYGYAESHREIIDRRTVPFGTEEERTRFAIENIDRIQGMLRTLDARRLAVAEFAQALVEQAEGGRPRHQELTMGLVRFRGEVDAYFRQYVVLLEAGFHQTILRHLRVLDRILRDHGRARGEAVLPVLAQRLERLGKEIHGSLELIKQYAPAPADTPLVPADEEDESPRTEEPGGER
ncbi:MAG: hypothetical protein D6731_15645 [Planctomycetota bacterium]|nr:MAG: hypothetical protein D6731_15645 [Planctomycetota bacterium]